MAYTANPTDPSVPLDDDGAGYGATEFRALKLYIQSLVLGAAGFKVPVRQTVLAASVSATLVAPMATPTPNFLAIGTGLQVDFKATGLPSTVLTYANGFDANGNVDYVTQLSADIANICGTLGASRTNYLYLDRLTGTTVTGGSTSAPPQEGYTYDRSQLASLTFSGTAGSTTFVDDNGNTWTAQGGAKHQVNQYKYGSGGLGGAGGANALNGAADYIRSSEAINFMRTDQGQWSIRGWVYPTALPGAGLLQYMAAGLNAAGTVSGTSFLFGIFNNAGTIRFVTYLSSENATWNIASAQVGTSLPAVNTWYYTELTYDGAIYRLYVNGIQEWSSASALRVAFPGNNGYVALGSSAAATTYINGYMDGWEFLPYCDHPAGTAYTTPTVDPSIIASAPNFMDITEVKMKRVTAASAVAGTNPTLTQTNRLYVGEAVTSGVAVTAVNLYALQGRYCSGRIAIASGGTSAVLTHNIGALNVDYLAEGIAKRSYGGLKPGERSKIFAVDTQFFPTDALSSYSPRECFVPKNRRSGALTAGNWSFGILGDPGFVQAGGLPNELEAIITIFRNWGRA